MDTRDMPIRERLNHVANVLDSLAAPQAIEITINSTRYRIIGIVWLKDADEFRRVMVGRTVKRDREYMRCEVDGVEFNAKEKMPACLQTQWEEVQL